MVIDGKLLSLKHQEKLKQELDALKKKSLRTPVVISFCNREDAPSVKYTDMKQKKAEEIGVKFIPLIYSSKTNISDLKQMIEENNQKSDVDGIMVQLPLSDRLNPFKEDLLDLIKPEKDIDGLTNEGRKIYLPATIKGTISILDSIKISFWEETFAVVGSEGEIGKPMVEVLKSYGARVLEIDKEIGDINTDLKSATVIISCTGQRDLIKPEMISGGVVLIDVGLGDFEEGCYEKARAYTPVTGGVGPMTVISLMENVVKSYELGNTEEK